MRNKISTLGLFFEDAFKSLKRNKTLTIASVLTVGLTMLVLGIFLVTTMTIDKNVNTLQDKLELRVYLHVPGVKDEAGKMPENIDEGKAKINEDKARIEEILTNSNLVQEYKFISEQEAFEKTKEIYGDVLEGLEDESFLPESFSVRFNRVEDIEAIKQELSGIESIEEIKDGKDIAEKFEDMTNKIKVVAMGLFVVLAAVSLFLISNTIKLTVYSRRREISIMKNIGATNWFIRWPFIIEGIIIGVFGTLVAMAVLYGVYSVIYSNLVMTGIVLLLPGVIINPMSFIFILGGVILGFLGSVVSIRKFLSV